MSRDDWFSMAHCDDETELMLGDNGRPSIAESPHVNDMRCSDETETVDLVDIVKSDLGNDPTIDRSPGKR